MREIQPCAIDDCERLYGVPGTGRGYCSRHYHRFQRYGDPLGGAPLREHSFMDALFRRVTVRWNGCWEWTGAIGSHGYGNVGTMTAHRATWEALVGPIPAGMNLDHLCRFRPCVNPDHLEPVTPAENLRRARDAKRGW